MYYTRAPPWQTFLRQMELSSLPDSLIWSSSICFFFLGLCSSQGFFFFEGHRKFKTNLPIIVLHGGMFTNDPCAHFWPQNLGNFDGLAKLGHFGHFGYFGHQREFLWPLGQRPFCLAQILYLIKYVTWWILKVSWFLTERWHAIRSSRKTSWKLSNWTKNHCGLK